MAWIEGVTQKTIRINASLARVYEFFITPAQMAPAFDDLERHDILDESTVHWLYKTKKEKGITFQPQCTIRYQGNGSDLVQWETVKPGTLRSTGHARLRAVDAQTTEVEYEEKTAVDLPIPGLLGKVFRPIVVREQQKSIFAYLDRAKGLMEKSAV